MDEVWIDMDDVDDNDSTEDDLNGEELYDPIRIKIQDKDRIYLDIGLKALHALQRYTGSFERIQFEGFMVIIAVEVIRIDRHG